MITNDLVINYLILINRAIRGISHYAERAFKLFLYSYTKTRGKGLLKRISVQVCQQFSTFNM